MESSQILDQHVAKEPNAINIEAKLASRSKRFANMIIDTIAYYIVLFMIGIVIGVITDNNEGASQYLDILLSLFISIMYYFGMEAMLGKTIGKVVTRTKVVASDGSKPAVKNVLGRSFARLIPFEAFSFLGGRAGWHDTLSDTRVINDN